MDGDSTLLQIGTRACVYVGDDAATLDLLKSTLGEQFAGR